MAAGNERHRLSRRGERAHRIVPTADVYAPLAVRGAGAMTLKKKQIHIPETYILVEGQSRFMAAHIQDSNKGQGIN